jgi:hypothetical protein
MARMVVRLARVMAGARITRLGVAGRTRVGIATDVAGITGVNGRRLAVD